MVIRVKRWDRLNAFFLVWNSFFHFKTHFGREQKGLLSLQSCAQETSSLLSYLHKTFDFKNNLNIIIYHLFEGPLSRTTKISTPSQASHMIPVFYLFLLILFGVLYIPVRGDNQNYKIALTCWVETGEICLLCFANS